jgi:hypothetical protein
MSTMFQNKAHSTSKPKHKFKLNNSSDPINITDIIKVIIATA